MSSKRAIVTGAASGIGKGIAERLAADGAEVAVFDVDLDAAKHVAEAIGGQAFSVDVSNSKEVDEAVAEFTKTGGLDILVNNAGISGGDETQHAFELGLKQMAEAATGRIDTWYDSTMIMTDEQWSRMIAVHLTGTFNCTRAALRLMTKQKSGAIVNISSIDAMIGLAGIPHYCAAKAGIIALTKTVALEVGRIGIRVNSVAPGYIDTPPFRKFLTPEAQTGLLLQTPMQRIGDVKEIAAAVAFLASEEASFITGQVLSPNGGLVMQ